MVDMTSSFFSNREILRRTIPFIMTLAALVLAYIVLQDDLKTSLMSVERNSFQTYSKMTEAINLSTFTFVSLLTAIFLNSSKAYSDIFVTKNLDKRGSIIFPID
jgi:hypothetical protein